MKLKHSTFSELAEYIKSTHKDVVIFGAGVIGVVTLPQIFYQYEIEDRILCYIDNDKTKQGTNVLVEGEAVKIYPFSHLKNIDWENTILLLAIGRYAGVLEQLNRMEFMQHTECYNAPFMCMTDFKQYGQKSVLKDIEKPVIPKVIHYMWLGGKPLPDGLKFCLESWQKYCPDYEIKRWDETNYNVDSHIYMKQAYEAGMYGFVPDYARLDILYRYGGIYMDTDVELKRNLDELLYQQAFCGVEKWQHINMGGCSGCVKEQRAVGEMLKERENVTFINEDGSFNKNTCGYYDLRAMLRNGYIINGKTQNILGMNIYTYDYFHPYDYMSGRMDITSDTFSIHHFNGSWLDKTMRLEIECTKKEFDENYLHYLMKETV